MESGLGSMFAQLVTPGALERFAGFLADVWRVRPVIFVLDDLEDLEEEEEDEEDDSDPIEELNAAEIVQIIRRDDSEIGVDFRGMEVDTALALVFRAAMQMMVEDMIDFEDEEPED